METSKPLIVALALALVATTARPALARRHDEFELKELREQRAEHQQEKAAIQEEQNEEKEKSQAHAHARPHVEKHHGRFGSDDGGGDLDGSD